MIKSARTIDENGTVEINGKTIYKGEKNHVGSAYRKWLAQGNNPEPYDDTQDERDAEKSWRDSELTAFVDYYQSKPLLFAELSDDQRSAVEAYRSELLHYPNSDGFPDIDRPERPVL